MSYDNAYQKNPNLWGNKPNILLTMFEYLFKANSNCLDLGCGQGRDALYFAKKGFNVTAVDSSSVAIDQFKKNIEEENAANLEAICADVKDYKIASGKYQIININNLLQFLPRKNSLELITGIKDNLSAEGIILINAFTTGDSQFVRTRDNKNATFFQPNELKELFGDFNILHYFEFISLDPGHNERPEPHLHGMVELAAQKRP
jgi:cyclopropane fatty-acyl-phospholipid synthase-like methyltransferase